MQQDTLTPDLVQLIDRLGESSRLMVVTDFDGTISHFTVEPGKAQAEPAAILALRALSLAPLTDVCIVSGRGLADLAERCRDIPGVRLVGSHGAEFGLDPSKGASPEQMANLERAAGIAQSAASRERGVVVERKPFSVALHTRALLPGSGQVILQEVTKAFYELRGGVVIEGHHVVEFLATTASKGNAVERLRQELHPEHLVILGDDKTDEEAFKVAGPQDATVKVGLDPTCATYRVRDVYQATLFLTALAERRARWIESTPATPIDHHVFLSDLRSFALLDAKASLVWSCAPRLDSPPLFGSIVGGPSAGEFSLKIDGVWSQRYHLSTLIAESSCTTSEGRSVLVTDFLDCGNGLPFQRAGRTDLVRWITGNAPVRVRFAPRVDFGRIPTKLSLVKDGLRVEGGNYPVTLHAPGVQWEIVEEGIHRAAIAEFTPGDGVLLELRMGTHATDRNRRSVAQRLEQTASFWNGWIATLQLPEIARHQVERSALVLRGLTYGPSGAIAAAATTSLPENIGGVRNWDYRFCWPRDASLSASALLRLGTAGPGIRLVDWILGVLAERGPAEFLNPVYVVDGRDVFGEAEVPQALGYRGSRPVRVGNLAGQQLQLDALGPIAKLLGDLARAGAPLTPEHEALARRMVELVQDYWERPDHGIWEVRTAQRHFVHSKIMCWLTVRECGFVSSYLGQPRPEWQELETAIRKSVEERGYSEEKNSYKAAYDLDAADASLLCVVLSGFHPPDHPRAIGTVAYVMSELLEKDAVYRYRFHDALAGGEGAFTLCTSWLIEALVMMGRTAEAQALFDVYLKRLGPLHLCAEEWDTNREMALGNFPQAYSHLGLINCACALADARRSLSG